MPDISRGGQLLKLWRTENKFSQFDAAIELGMHPQMLSRYERGIGTPGRKAAVTIEEKTGGLVSVSSWDAEAEVDAEGAA